MRWGVLDIALNLAAVAVPRMSYCVLSNIGRRVGKEELLLAVDTFLSFIKAMEAATTQAELDAAASGPGKPAKGTKEHAAATEVYMRKVEEFKKGAAA